MKRPATTTPLPYPASGHVLRYARLAFDATTPGQTEGLMPALPDLCEEGGGIRLGAICLLADYAAGVTALASVQPDWPVTHDLAVHLVAPAPPEGELEATCEVVRAGRNSVISETSVRSPVAGEVARVFVTFTRLPRRPDTPTARPGGLTNLAEDRSIERPRVPLDEAVGFRLATAADGDHGQSVVAFDHSPFIVNSLGAIQGGVVALALERSASWAGEQSLGRPCRTTDLHLHYLALGRTGPFEARAELLRVDDTVVTSRVGLVDTGDDDRLLALGVASAQPV
ncbi:MAG: PaaI family thioesterase [Actinomycetota bacterium]